MRVYTSHVKAGDLPVLVGEGFSIGAALFGWLWLLWWRAWIAAVILFALDILLWRAPASPFAGAVSIAVFVLQGLFGRDIVRWSLGRSGYAAGPVVAAPTHDGALLRLLTERADLTPGGLAG
jgi:hypothetical protein